MLTKQGQSLLLLYLSSCGYCMSEFSFSVAVRDKSTVREGGLLSAPRQSEKTAGTCSRSRDHTTCAIRKERIDRKWGWLIKPVAHLSNSLPPVTSQRFYNLLKQDRPLGTKCSNPSLWVTFITQTAIGTNCCWPVVVSNPDFFHFSQKTLRRSQFLFLFSPPQMISHSYLKVSASGQMS